MAVGVGGMGVAVSVGVDAGGAVVAVALGRLTAVEVGVAAGPQAERIIIRMTLKTANKVTCFILILDLTIQK